MIRSLIKKKFPAARLALTVGLGGSLLAANAAFAQSPSQPNATTADAASSGPADRVIVTGSNIPSAAEVGTARVDTVDEAARDRTGQQDVLSVLQRADPSFSGGGNLGQSNASIASASTYGGSSVSIHGLPTLVLLNGRRVADSAAQAAGGAAFVDVNLFPTALIKRIEVLKDGASAIYGSEAIGGVVNVILNQEFRGLEIDGRYGFTEKSDIKDKRISAIVGLGDDKTSIVIGGQYTEQDPIFNRDRQWAGPSFGTTNYSGVVKLQTNPLYNTPAKITAAEAAANADLASADPALQNQGNAIYSAIGAGYKYFTLGSNFTSPQQLVADGALADTTSLVASGVLNGPYSSTNISQGGPVKSGAPVIPGFNLSNGTGITLDQNRTSFFGEFSREIWADHITFYGEFLYSHNYAQSYLNAQPINLTETDSSNNALSIPAGLNNPFSFPVGQVGAAADGVNTASNELVDVRARFTDFPRIFRTDTDFYRVVAGLKGSIIKSIDLDYDISFNTSQNEINYRNSNLIEIGPLNTALANGTVNLFSTANQDAAIAASGTLGTNFRDLKSALNVFDAGITAFPVKLPAGPLGVAAGFEYRFEKFRFNDSPEIFVGSVPVPEINRGRDIYAAYAEVSVPVISPTMKIPGVYSLDLDGAGRMEKYEGINSSFVPKVSFVYRPIEDVAVRGTFSKSFIAPTLLNLYGPVSQGFSNSVDLGAGAEQANEEGGSNSKLAPSTADTYSVGIVLSPKQVPGLTLSADFFHVEQKNAVTALSDNFALASVNLFGAASPVARLIHYGSFTGPTGFYPGGSAPSATSAGYIAGNAGSYYFVNGLQNQGLARLGGIDFNANYARDFGKFGGVTIGINGVYYLQYKLEDLAGESAYDTIGYYLSQANEVPQYKLAPYVEYRLGGFKASALMNYTPSVRDTHDNGNPAGLPIELYQGPAKDGYNPKIRDYYTVDLLFAYTFGMNKPEAAPMPAPAPKDGKDGGKQVVSKEVAKKMATSPMWLDGLSLGFGINNVTNARPPRIVDSPDATNTDAALYDPYQRLYYFTVEKKF